MSYSGWTTFNFDDEVDLQVTKCWMMAVPYSIPVRKPLDHWCLLYYAERSFAWAVDQLMVPTTRGISLRSIQGLFYLGLRPATDEQVKQREPVFRERLRPWIEDFEGLWRGKLLPELMGHYDRLKQTDVGKLSDIELMHHFEYFLSVMQRSLEIRFLPMYAVYMAYKLFGDMCRELVGIDEDDLQFKKLMTGFDSIAYDVDRGLWRLGDRAKELGLEPLFQATPDNEELLSALVSSDPGMKWLQELHEFLSEHGWRAERLLDLCLPTWIEQPALALPSIRGDMAKGGAFVLDQEHERRFRDREEAEREVLFRVPPDKRDWFLKLMRTAQWAGIYTEEHDYYIDLYLCGLGRRILVEIGKRCAQDGVLDDPDDINFLFPDDIVRLLARMDISVQRKLARVRREEWQGYGEGALRMLAGKMFIGDQDWFLENLNREPVTWVFAGIPKVKPELKADLYGLASTPGVAEGKARVATDVAQLSELQPGEILVTPCTGPAWNPAFGYIKGVVTDTGGALSHAVIVAREYGIPCVAGTQEATRKIQTGMRLRVDGDNGAVYILKRRRRAKQ